MTGSEKGVVIYYQMRYYVRFEKADVSREIEDIMLLRERLEKG